MQNIPNVEWKEARIAVFMESERLDSEVKRCGILIGQQQEKISKIVDDLHAAHEKVRTLVSANTKLQMESSDMRKQVTEARIRAAQLSAVVTGTGFLILELLRLAIPYLMHH